MRSTPIITAIRSVAVSDSINYGDGTIVASDTLTLTLPKFPEIAVKYTVKATGNGKTVTVDGNGANIDGSSTKDMTVQYSAYTFQWDGTTWHTV